MRRVDSINSAEKRSPRNTKPATRAGRSPASGGISKPSASPILPENLIGQGQCQTAQPEKAEKALAPKATGTASSEPKRIRTKRRAFVRPRYPDLSVASPEGRSEGVLVDHRARQLGLDPTVVSPAAILVLRRFRGRVRRGVSPTFYRIPILSKVTAPASPHSERSPPSSRRFRPAKCQKCLPQWCLCSSKASCQGVFPKWRLVTRLLGLGRVGGPTP